jgi:hypothetical protein
VEKGGREVRAVEKGGQYGIVQQDILLWVHASAGLTGRGLPAPGLKQKPNSAQGGVQKKNKNQMVLKGECDGKIKMVPKGGAQQGADSRGAERGGNECGWRGQYGVF